MSISTTARVSVVILNWNGQKFLEQFLGNVVQHSEPIAKMVVADNASTDGSVDYVRKNHPTVLIQEMPENTGYTGGYNRSLALLDTEYFLLLNSDIEVTEGWLAPLLKLMDSNPQIGAVQPKIRDYNRKDYFEYAGASGGYLDYLGYPFCRGRIFQDLEKDESQYEETQPVFWATGACMMVRKAAFQACGGLDERFFAHMEEIDLCWRMHREGYSVYVCPSSVVYHVGGGTLSRSNPKKTYLNFRNNLLMLANNLTRKEFNKIYFLRLFLDYLAALSFLFSSGSADMKAVLKAHKDFRDLHRKQLLEHPDPGKSKPNVKIPLYPRSILFDYYLCRRKKFSQLPLFSASGAPRKGAL